MRVEEFRMLAGVIALHKDRTLIGRTRLQKTLYLLQRFGFPTTYTYTLHFYGPYSEELVSDVQLLEALGLISEAADGTRQTYYRYKALPSVDEEPVQSFTPYIQLFEKSDPIVLELAATYEAFRQLGYDTEEALRRLKRKKGEEKCTPENLEDAFALLSDAKKLTPSN